MRTIYAGKLLLAVLLLAVPSWAGPLAHLREEATVKGTAIRLGDVARIEGDAKSRKRLAAMEIGPSPLPGKSRRVNRDYILIRLRQQQLDPAILAADSVKECLVTRSFRTLSSDQLIKTAMDFLTENLEPGEGKLAIEPISHLRDMALPEGAPLLAADFIGKPSTLATRRISIRISVDGVSFGKVDVSLRVRRFAKVAVALSAIRRGEALTPDKISYEERDRMSLPVGVFLEDQPLDGFQAIQSIPSGAPITRSAASLPPVIHRGDQVLIRARIGGIEVSSPGIASEDGCTGETIRVRNSSSNQETRVQVLDNKTVLATL